MAKHVENMRNRLVASNRAKSTVDGYTYGVKQLALFCNRPLESIESENVYAFLVYLKEERGLSRDTMRISACGIKYLYNHIIKRDEMVNDIPYPKKEKYLPEILTGDELKNLFNKTDNIKRRAFLKLVYSAGLRREEACNLLITDIDSKNMQVHARQGKGKKDRYTILGSSCTCCPKALLKSGIMVSWLAGTRQEPWVQYYCNWEKNPGKALKVCHELKYSWPFTGTILSFAGIVIRLICISLK